MKKFLKYLWRILVGIFALIGILVVGRLWYLYSHGYDIQIVSREDQLAERAELLKQSSFSVPIQSSIISPLCRIRPVLRKYGSTLN